MELKIECVKNLSEEETRDILKINHDNLDVNGGQLHFAGILSYKYAVLAKINNHVVGYTLLFPSFLTKKDLYVMQVAVNKNYHHCGIGSKMYDYAYNHAKGYFALTANASEENFVSQKFHKKMGFKDCGTNELGIVYAKPITKNITKSFDDAKPKYFDILAKNNEETL